MTTIQLTTRIEAPVERVYDLSRSIDLHLASTARTGERAIGGVTRGLIDLGEQVVWSARHFGVRFEMTVRLTGTDRPRWFRDEMIRGPFHRLEHDHVFEPQGPATLLHDTFRFAFPCGALGGRLIDRRVLRPHLQGLLVERNRWLKEVAESNQWKRFLSEESSLSNSMESSS